MHLLRYGLITFLVSMLAFQSNAQSNKSSKDVLESITQTPELAGFFDGIFNHLGIVIQETGEELTAHHEGDHIRIEEGMNRDEVDFVLPLELRNVSDLVEQSADGEFDEVEATKIARVFFTPFTKVTLKNEVLSANRKRKAAGIEDLIHVHLLFPDGSEAASHTLIYVADQWIVLEELVGNPKRVFKLTHGPALEYQRKIFHAMEVDTRKEWLRFVKWYKDWRKDYSETM